MSLKSVEILFSGEPTIVYINQGPAGDSFSAPISTITDTNLTGYIYGNGTKIAGATPGSHLAEPSKMAIRLQNGGLACTQINFGEVGGIPSLLQTSGLTTNRTYTLPDASGYVALTTNANGSVTNSEVYVKAGQNISAGNAVYISGASGSNKIVSLAQANTDSLSSKTLGLSLQNLSTNQFGYIVSEGKLSGLSINLGAGHTVVEGDPIWLSPTTPGELLFGLANKPSAPNHLVSLGVVTNINGNTLTDIFVKVQNGFELGELHDVQISSPSNGQVLTYDLSTDLWKNADSQGGGGSITTSTTTNLTGFISGDGTNISGATNGSATPDVSTIAIRDNAARLHATQLRLYQTSGSSVYTQVNPAASASTVAFQFPSTAGTIATNNSAVMLTGDQSNIFGTKTFQGTVYLANNSGAAIGDSYAMTRMSSDRRYASFNGISSAIYSSNSSTNITTAALIVGLRAGTYELDFFAAAYNTGTNPANANISIKFLNADGTPSLVSLSLHESFGSPESSTPSNTIIANDAISETSRSSSGTAVEFMRKAKGILVVPADNNRIFLDFSQAVTNGAAPSYIRKRAYIIARPLI